MLFNSSTIGAAVGRVRKQRGWSQATLARELGISQPRLSQVEHGSSSLTAEQFLHVLRIFNLTTHDFFPPTDAVGEVQDALRRFGAPHLHRSENLLPSERLVRLDAAIEEALVTAHPRLLTALAPVIVNNIDSINIMRLSARLLEPRVDDKGIRKLQRLYWVIDNVLTALRDDRCPVPRFEREKAKRVLARALLWAPERGTLEFDKLNARLDWDYFDEGIDEISEERLKHQAPTLAKKWKILTRLSPEDFLAAIEANYQ